MFCSGCGTANPDTATFCNKCGQPLSGGRPSPPPPPAPAYVGPTQSSGKATGSLVLGILGIMLSWLLVGLPLAIAAIVLGHVSYSQIKQSAGRLTGQSKALAGLIMGYLSLVTLPFALIVAAIAIPNLLRARIAANEAAAVGAIRTINIAEITYQTTYNQGYTCDLAALDGRSQGPADASHAQLIDSTLASGQKSGYRFELSGCDGTSPEHFKVVAVPLVANQSGQRAFCSDDSGIIRYDAHGSGEDCLASGPPLQ